jgi:hypothetical protein
LISRFRFRRADVFCITAIYAGFDAISITLHMIFLSSLQPFLVCGAYAVSSISIFFDAVTRFSGWRVPFYLVLSFQDFTFADTQIVTSRIRFSFSCLHFFSSSSLIFSLLFYAVALSFLYFFRFAFQLSAAASFVSSSFASFSLHGYLFSTPISYISS